MMGKIVQISMFKWGFWIRVFGKGIWLGKDNGLPPLFSERYGHKIVKRFLGFKFQLLN